MSDTFTYLGAGVPTFDGDLLTVGEETIHRRWVTNNSSAPLTSGTLRLTYFTARKTETTTQVRVAGGNAAAAATPTLIRFGLWLIAADGGATLVASIANDLTIFAAANTAYTRSWTTPYAKVAGQRYAFGALCVSGATVPQICSNSMNAVNEPSAAPRLSGAITSQTDLPATFADASVAATGTSPYAAILP